MTISVYPRYVGPTTEYRLASLYPKWLDIVGDIIVPPDIPDFIGDVIVLDVQTGVAAIGSAVAAMVATAEAGVLDRTTMPNVLSKKGTTGATVSVVEYGMRTIGGAWGMIYATLQAGAVAFTAKLNVTRRGESGVEVRDEDPEI